MAGGSIYLDHAATTPVHPEVTAAMEVAQREGFANPSSLHAAGRRAKLLLEDARERIVAALGGRPTGPGRDRLVFTSGATEANRLAILGLAAGSPGRAVFVSARDHSSVRLAARELADRGWTLVDQPLTAAGSLRDTGALPSGGGVLAGTLVCGQTGVRDDLAGLRDRPGRPTGLAVHVDATQAIAFDAPRFEDLPVESLACAAHKIGGPRGIGALVVRPDLRLAPLQPGPQESGLRGGTEPVALAVGFARACELAVADRRADAERIAALRARLEAGAAAAWPDAVVVGRSADRAPHIATIAFPGCDRQALVMAADLEGLCCSTGTACASGSGEPAPALVAAGLPAEIVRSAVRFSLGRGTTATDIDDAVTILQRILSRGRPTGRGGSP